MLLFLGLLTPPVSVLVVNGEDGCLERCTYGRACWPTDAQVSTFAGTITGSVIKPTDAGYDTAKYMLNPRIQKDPRLIVNVATAEDVQTCVLFAKDHGLRVAVKSSGHSFIGRSTVEEGLIINMINMDNITVQNTTIRNTNGEVEVQSGATWAKVYEEVDKHDRVVVGAADSGVAMGGYSQGGGHGPYSRMHGLAVDNLLEVHLVTPDGVLRTVSATGTTVHNSDGSTTNNADTDLFWAVRGGGGDAWGVVIRFTFKLHPAPSGFTIIVFTYPFWLELTPEPGKQVMKAFFEHSKTMDKKYGCYILFSNVPIDNTGRNYGAVVFALIYFGEYSVQVQADVNSFKNAIVWKTGRQPWTEVTKNYTTFWNYEKTVPSDRNPTRARHYLYNILTQDDTDYNAVVDLIGKQSAGHPEGGVLHGCTSTFLGGQMRQSTEETAVSPYFKSALHSLSCYIAWMVVSIDDKEKGVADRYGYELAALGKASYFNEAAACLTNWKELFWGSTKYERLLSIKKKYDPTNLFSCAHCVGCDLEHQTPKAYCPVCKSEDKCYSPGNAMSAIYILSIASLILSYLCVY